MEYAKHDVKCLLCDQFISVVSNKDHNDLLEEHVQCFRHKLRYVQLEAHQREDQADERDCRTSETYQSVEIAAIQEPHE
jgi:hypothetical protein